MMVLDLRCSRLLREIADAQGIGLADQASGAHAQDLRGVHRSILDRPMTCSGERRTLEEILRDEGVPCLFKATMAAPLVCPVHDPEDRVAGANRHAVAGSGLLYGRGKFSSSIPRPSCGRWWASRSSEGIAGPGLWGLVEEWDLVRMLVWGPAGRRCFLGTVNGSCNS